MIESFTNMGMFEYEPEIVSNPMFDFLKKSKTSKINLKFASFRKISKYFEEVSSENATKKHEVKGFSYTNKGIFRQKADINVVFGNKYTANALIKFESEDVFTRLLKVYMTVIHKQFDINLAEHWW